MMKFKVDDPIWSENYPGDIGFIVRLFPYSGIAYVRFSRGPLVLERIPIDDLRVPVRLGNIIPMDQQELGPEFFMNPILTRPGESIIDIVERERGMCTEPLNPNLPHWRRAAPLVGEERKAAQRVLANIENPDWVGPSKVRDTDWNIYYIYWKKVKAELQRHNPGLTTDTVNEEVRKRLKDSEDGNEEG